MNLYSDLGVKKEATKDEIKRAYRKKANETHPDHGGNAEKFGEIQKAYKILSDDEKRKRYDSGEDPETLNNGPTQKDLALASVISLFFSVLEGREEGRSDIFKIMQRSISESIQIDKQEINNLNWKIKKFQSEIKRISNKKNAPINLFVQAIENRIADIQRDQATLEEKSEVARLALEIIDDYKYEVEQQRSGFFPGQVFSTNIDNWR